MITLLSLNNEFRRFAVNSPHRSLDGLSKVNILIGPNNSGKSHFARTVYSTEDFDFRHDKVPLQLLNRLIEDLSQKIQSYFERHQIIEFGNIKNVREYIRPVPFLSATSDLELDVLNKVHTLRDQPSTMAGGQGLSFEEIRAELTRYATDFLSELPKIPRTEDLRRDHLRIQRIYIPLLRGLRGFGSINDDQYFNRTVKDYFENKSEKFRSTIYTGLNLYAEVTKLLLGPKKDRDRIRDFEGFLSNNFFFEKDVSLIPRQNEDVLHVRIGSQELPIHQLGDGIQSVICLTYPLFFNRGSNALFIIEEPEHGLHPGLQRIFLETILKPDFDSFQYFLTTHSNHFLDLTLDVDKISIFTFRREDNAEEPSFTIENVSNDDKRTLDLLGVRNSSVFLTNCTIWVEGITDRMYLKKYLDLYQSTQAVEFKEDVHFSFVEYGGSNVTHWSFLDEENQKSGIDVEKLCGKLLLVTDRDSNKNNRHQKLKLALNERFCCLESREIENVLHPSIIEKVILSYEKRIDGQEPPKFEFDHSVYKDVLLGEFINNNVAGLKRSYAADSGTIKDKVNFARKAVLEMNSLTDLTAEAKDLVSKIYSFIRSNNLSQ